MSGLEGLGFVGVIQVIQTGCQALLSYYKEYRQFPRDMQEVTARVGRLTLAIDALRQLDFDWSSPQTPLDLVEFNHAVSELEGCLGKYGRPGPTRLDRLRYALFGKTKFTNALEKVNKIQIDINTAAHIYEMKLLEQGNKKMDSLVSDTTQTRTLVNQQLKEQCQTKFWKWLSAPDTEGDHYRLSKEMLPGSGSWVLNTPQIQDWISNDETRIVWIHGTPGSGKSVIASNTVNHLLERYNDDPRVAIAYIYHDSHNPKKLESICQVITAIISQLCGRLGDIPGQLMEFSEKNRSPAAMGIHHIVWIAGKFKTVYLAIDGLDEWHSTGIGELLGLVLQLTNETSVTFKILITSRFENQISLKLGDCNAIDLVEKGAQVTGDIEQVMRAKVDSQVYLQDPTRKEEIVSVLTSRSQGVFLWAILALDDLREVSLRTKEDRSTFKCLDTLPSGMDKFYEHILTKILKQPSLRYLVEQSLGWLYYSKRPLSASELVAGLSYDIRLEAPSRTEIMSACRPLVIEHDDSLQFVHFSFRQYMADKRESFSWLLETAPAITAACLECLSNVANRWPLHIKVPPRQLLIEFPFAQHAADHWGHYAADGLPHDRSGSLGQEVEDLLLREDFVAALGKLMSPVSAFNELWPFAAFNDRDLHGAPDAMHLVAYFGLHTLIPNLMSKGIESTPHPGPDGIRTPLAWAARFGHLKCVRELARNYPDHLNCKDRQGLTPLSWAAISGFEDVIRELARSPGLDVACRDDEGRTAISFAAEFGYTSIVGRLRNLDESIVDVPDDDGLTPLCWAAYGDRLDTVKLFIEQFDVQANLDALLRHAVDHGSVTVARYLMENHRVNPFAVDDLCERAFLIAVERGNKDIVEIIMDRQWNVGKYSQDFLVGRTLRKYIYGSGLLTAIDPPITPLFDHTHQEWLIKALLPKADVNYTSSSGKTPLIAAASTGSKAIVEMLLKDPNIDINKTDETLKSAWLYARDNNHFSIMEMLQNRDCIQLDYREVYGRLFHK